MENEALQDWLSRGPCNCKSKPIQIHERFSFDVTIFRKNKITAHYIQMSVNYPWMAVGGKIAPNSVRSNNQTIVAKLEDFP